MEHDLHIALQQVGKQFYRRWIFREISTELAPGSRLALVGTNGSGKSTLLRIIAGQLGPTEGTVSYHQAGKRLNVASVYQHISWAGPQVEMYTELSLEELLDFHFRLKPCLLSSPTDIIALLRFEGHSQKPLKYFSSGMQQRAKVGIALLTASPVLLLDEPTSNMDAENARRMLLLIEQYRKGRTFVLASNMEREFQDFEQVLHL